jgi:hypothetical protein
MNNVFLLIKCIRRMSRPQSQENLFPMVNIWLSRAQFIEERGMIAGLLTQSCEFVNKN